MSNPHIKRAILVADAGGTSTNWQLHIDLCHDNSNCNFDFSAISAGINAANATANALEESIDNAFRQLTDRISKSEINLIDFKDLLSSPVTEIFFYGAGCKSDESLLRIMNSCHNLAGTDNISVNSDLLGAARATLGKEPGIAAIIGTGSNSGLYDGTKLIANTPPMGYILGDEGSGTSIGKQFLSDIFKDLAPRALTEYVTAQLGITQDSVIKSVYRSDNPASYLASQIKIIADILESASQRPLDFPDVVDYLEKLIKDSFILFFKRNFAHYSTVSDVRNVSFVGSVAYHFRNILRVAAEECGYKVKGILASPINHLVDFHVNYPTNE